MDGKLKFHLDIDIDSVKSYDQFEERITLTNTRAWEEINRGE